ncbi:MAG: MazG family protein [Candidatus Nanopelagicales bacterium]|jgi:XTP/dITP diphosphohydrolase|nr:MazG family protein [Candidatus Nanopelagicales bacterium]
MDQPTHDPGPRAVPTPSGESLLELIAVMDRLRSPGGCPWDAEQTHLSLVSYLTEEAHEAVEAIETGDRAAMREELGDVLLQVMFHSRIAQEDASDPWSIDDVAAGIAAKLVARHPHVFGDESVDSAAHVESVWLARKTAEKARTSVLDGIPAGLPALLLAAKMHYRVTHGGVQVDPVDPATRARAVQALDEVGPEGLGDLLLALATEALDRGADPESALRGALRGYAERVRAAEPDPGRGPQVNAG